MANITVTKVGGTTGQFWGNEYSMTYGVDIKNPNRDQLAFNVSVDITFKDSAGRVLKVVNDTIYNINPGETFHYGGEASGLYANPTNISASAFAREYVSLDEKNKMDFASFGNFTKRVDGAFGSVTGEIYAKYNIPFERFFLYFQYIDYRGEIVGGGSEFIDYLPGGSVRAIQHNGFVPDTASKLEYTFDLSVLEYLEQVQRYIG